MGVDNFTNGHVIISAANIVHEGHRVRPFDADFTERRHVVHANILTHSHVFFADVVKEVLAQPTVFIFRFLGFACKPIGAFPSGQFAHHSATLKQVFVEWRAANATRCCLLAEWKMIGVQQAKRLFRPLEQVCFVALEWLHPRNVDIAQIERLFACVHPLCQCHTCATRGLNSD